MKHYSLRNILQQNALYNVIFGERSNGKTFAVLELALFGYHKDGIDIHFKRGAGKYNRETDKRKIQLRLLLFREMVFTEDRRKWGSRHQGRKSVRLRFLTDRRRALQVNFIPANQDNSI